MDGGASLRSDWIDAFVRFAEHLNFTRAAKVLHISQPALHVQIAKLSESRLACRFTPDLRSRSRTHAGGDRGCSPSLARRRSGRTQVRRENLQGETDDCRVTLCAGEGTYLYLLGNAIRTFSKRRSAMLRPLDARCRGDGRCRSVGRGSPRRCIARRDAGWRRRCAPLPRRASAARAALAPDREKARRDPGRPRGSLPGRSSGGQAAPRDDRAGAAGRRRLLDGRGRGEWLGAHRPLCSARPLGLAIVNRVLPSPKGARRAATAGLAPRALFAHCMWHGGGRTLGPSWTIYAARSSPARASARNTIRILELPTRIVGARFLFRPGGGSPRRWPRHPTGLTRRLRRRIKEREPKQDSSFGGRSVRSSNSHPSTDGQALAGRARAGKA